ncbi:MAG: DUF3301 domain-containing protein [Thiogranum sp.]
MESTGLLLLILLGLFIWFWQNTLHDRELALLAARDVCRHQQLQLLDATVTLQRLALRRSPRGGFTLQRTFQFAYSTEGDDRRTGFVITLGNHVEQVGL